MNKANKSVKKTICLTKDLTVSTRHYVKSTIKQTISPKFECLMDALEQLEEYLTEIKAEGYSDDAYSWEEKEVEQ